MPKPVSNVTMNQQYSNDFTMNHQCSNEVTMNHRCSNDVTFHQQPLSYFTTEHEIKMVNKVEHKGEFKLNQLCGNLKRCFNIRVRVVSVVDDKFLKIADSTGCVNFRKDYRFPDLKPGDNLILENCREKVDNLSVSVCLMRNFGVVRKLDDVISYVTSPNYSDACKTLIFPTRIKKKNYSSG